MLFRSIALGEPEMNGIGGNGFATLFDRKTGKVISLAMAGAAPKRLKPAEMTPETLNAGMNAGIVPGNLGGYLFLLDRYGTMSVADVFSPAIEYAEKGFPVSKVIAWEWELDGPAAAQRDPEIGRASCRERV